MGTAKIFPEAQNIFPHPSNFPFFPFCFFFCLSFVFLPRDVSTASPRPLKYARRESPLYANAENIKLRTLSKPAACGLCTLNFLCK